MGLELVEYYMALEDAFEIDIPNEDASRHETPAQLIEYLCARLGEQGDGAPLVQTAFYRLRSAIADELKISRSAIRPTTLLLDLTERPQSVVWKGVAQRLGIDVKHLTHAPVLQWLANMRKAEPRTVGAMAEQLAMLQPAAMKATKPGWTRAQITEVVLRLLKHESAVEVPANRLDLQFVRDLDMG